MIPPIIYTSRPDHIACAMFLGIALFVMLSQYLSKQYKAKRKTFDERDIFNDKKK